MATTGFCPVRGKLKDIIDYAENPDKTTEREYLGDDLYDALRYVENDDKTDRKMYVSAINCSKSMAYEQMTAIKRKYGERGKVIAYHGYQSFEEGEVTPEEAHQIGVETARRMWGDRFQVVVTTHLNTANLQDEFCQGYFLPKLIKILLNIKPLPTILKILSVVTRFIS